MVTCDSVSPSACKPQLPSLLGFFPLLDSVHGIILLGVKKFEASFLLNGHHFHTMSKSRVTALTSGASGLSSSPGSAVLSVVSTLHPLVLVLSLLPFPPWKLLSGRVYLHPQMKLKCTMLCPQTTSVSTLPHNFPIIPGPQGFLPCTLPTTGVLRLSSS